MSNWDRWQDDHEEFLQLNEQFERLGILDPYAREAELMAQDPNNPGELRRVQNAIRLLEQLRERAKRNRASFEEATSSLLEALNINQDTGSRAENNASRAIRQSQILSVLAISLGSTLAVVFGQFLSNGLVQRLQRSVVQIISSPENQSKYSRDFTPPMKTGQVSNQCPLGQ
ncbi:hypothetical protein PN466_21175 [Roseofilum reptotaenium CS-1145]|uniref:Uncharacterized protein n=1 Tax=Roseofilum reptotaenium AO1-A TaxID=1925591 RepID=A0A1L9QJM0_9CYAN|nr:hypothetical protein [Roseofilum reptotaenium]MDB9519460.1 hypothetical protein [Roseofilum reptotaenium CS-1145]OJJ14661.1 hypothetical protein BI308_24820 [Roseofilum reptotaenium AO1-A]